jgi:hypothetical protein
VWIERGCRLFELPVVERLVSGRDGGLAERLHVGVAHDCLFGLLAVECHDQHVLEARVVESSQ